MENTLNIQLKVTDEQMTSLIKGKLESLPDEKIQEIFANALSEFFKTNDGQKLFYTKRYYDSDPQPTQLLTQMIGHAVSKDLLKPCADELVETLKNNYTNLLQSAMVQTFSNLFMAEMREAELKMQLDSILSVRSD